MPKCEFHDEAFRVLHNGICEIKDRLDNGSDQFKDLEKSKLGWKAFTWIIGILMVIWLSIQGVLWHGQQSITNKVIELDKNLAVYNALTKKALGIRSNPLDQSDQQH